MSATVVRQAEADAVRARVAELGPWFHNLDLGGVWTAPDHFLGNYPADKFARFRDVVPQDLTGKTVLDIGCNAGFYAMEMKRRGAHYVLGIDSDDRYLEQARFAAETLGYDNIAFRNLSVYDVAAIGQRFDLVVFMGVLYHLRHPLLALDLIYEHVAGDMLLFQTLQRGADAVFDAPDDHPFAMPGSWDPPAYFDEPGYPKLHFVEKRYAGDWTNWWLPNRAASEAMLRSAGFRIDSRGKDDVYLCRRDERPFAQLWAGEGGPAVYPAKGGTE